MKTMKTTRFVLVGLVLFGCFQMGAGPLACKVNGAEPKELPPLLEPWRDWVTWQDAHGACPSPFNDAQKHLCFWPSRLSLKAEGQAGSWTMALTLFEEAWVPLPGDASVWPHEVRAGLAATGELQPVVVVERAGVPATRLAAGRYALFRHIPLGQNAPADRDPQGDRDGVAGRRRQSGPDPQLGRAGESVAQTDSGRGGRQGFALGEVYRVIEDGIPMWLHSEIELTVSGKSREEQLGVDSSRRMAAIRDWTARFRSPWTSGDG